MLVGVPISIEDTNWLFGKESPQWIKLFAMLWPRIE